MTVRPDRSIHAEMSRLLRPIVDNRCYPNMTPDKPVFPLIVYQVVGGEVVEFYDRTIANTENYRVQVYVWAKSRLEAEGLIRQVRKVLVEESSSFDALKTLGQATDEYNEVIKIYGSRQDFSVWLSFRD